MTATFLLIRHAAHGHLNRILTGRNAGVPLTEAGRGQAARLGARLAGEPIDLVQSSPRERAVGTARALGRGEPAIADALDEIDFGDWTGKRFDELAGDPAWHEWNRRRSLGRTPGGETAAAAQRRIFDHLQHLAERLPGGCAALVTHCDTIRAAVCWALGLDLDNIARFAIDPASVTRIRLDATGVCVMSLNERTD